MLQIETKRLILREYEETDWESAHKYAKQGEILIYEVWGPNTEEETKAFINKSIKESKESPRKAFELGVTLKETGELIGGCGFRINKKNELRGNLGYIINPDYWNNGYATEAARAMLNFMTKHNNISEIEATCDALNLPSKRVLERCGLQKVKSKKRNIEIKGRVRNTDFYEKITEMPLSL